MKLRRKLSVDDAMLAELCRPAVKSGSILRQPTHSLRRRRLELPAFNNSWCKGNRQTVCNPFMQFVTVTPVDGNLHIRGIKKSWNRKQRR